MLSGTDTNCGTTYSALPAAVKAGLLSEADLDRTLERLFVARMKLGLFDPPETVPYAQIPFSQDRSPKHLALSLTTAREAMVLLKNDGILPLAPGKYKRIAVIGPNAASLSALEGNYNAVPNNPQMPVEALREALHGAKVTYSEGAPYADGAPLPVPVTMLRQHKDGTGAGLKAEYFAGAGQDISAGFSGAPVATREDAQVDFDWNSAAPVPQVKQDAFAVRWSGYIVPPQAGDLEFNMRLAHCYPCGDKESFAVKVDGKTVSTTRPMAASSARARPRAFTSTSQIRLRTLSRSTTSTMRRFLGAGSRWSGFLRRGCCRRKPLPQPAMRTL